jgi:hypothetical protein
MTGSAQAKSVQTCISSVIAHLCDMHALGDERHLVFARLCSALGMALPGLFAVTSIPQFMWPDDIVGVAHFMRDCFDLINAPDNANDASSNQP